MSIYSRDNIIVLCDHWHVVQLLWSRHLNSETGGVHCSKLSGSRNNINPSTDGRDSAISHNSG